MQQTSVQGQAEKVPRSIYVGLFFVALTTLMYELLLTRIFSVTMYYHFAFMAVSTAMFGMTFGAMLPYAFPSLRDENRLAKRLSLLSLGCAFSIVIAMLMHIEMPPGDSLVLRALATSLTYVLVAIPFVFGGVLLSLLFASFGKRVGSLYAADLFGAACGCLLLVWSLNYFDGFSEVLFVALLGCVAAASFAQGGERRFRLATFAALGGTAVLLCLHSYLFVNDLPGAVRIHWVKGTDTEKPLYEKWNSFSRVTVWGDMSKPAYFIYPGVSKAYRFQNTTKGLNLEIDGCARTTMVGFDGDMRKLEALRFNASNLVYQLKKDPRVLIVGSGGGYDVVSALGLGARSVEAVDINGNIIDAVNVRFGDFTGHLDRLPNVRFVNDEARSHVARSPEVFDVIEMSFIDTWAATASGAYVLTENALYTVEAWDVFLKHLSADGIFSVSRWYERKTPAEMYRLVALASESLRRLGIADPAKHMIIVRNTPEKDKKDGPDGVGVLLVSRAPFPESIIDRVNEICDPLGFEVIFSPRASSADPIFAVLAGVGDYQKLYKEFPLNITPPTDDSPFFFNMMRWQSIVDKELMQKVTYNFNMQAVSMLLCLLLSSIGLSYLCIYFPLVYSKEKPDLKGSGPLSAYFFCIGLAFMFIEISQIQHCIVFLGHPVYGITVVLFTLLCSSGIGSWSASFLEKAHGAAASARALILRLAALPVVLVLFGLFGSPILDSLRQESTVVRIAAVVCLLFVVGFVLGAAFPMGIIVANKRKASLISLFWGINGAGSVIGSILTLLVSIAAGIAVSYWLGVAIYIVAFLLFAVAAKKDCSEPDAVTAHAS